MLYLFIKELKEVRNCDEANFLLNKGWLLLAVSTQCYIMGRPEDVKN